ncbi:MAG: isocitrate lyase/phosphoenolpyruvate mutase family protein [Nocardioidaceae bacterium]
MSTTEERATELGRLHEDERLLTLVNVWDVASARVVAATPGTTALATASHAVAATFGFDDGEVIPRDLMLDMVGRVVASTHLPVTADLEAGYGDAGETVRRAIGLGVVGANIEDELVPLSDAAARMAAVVAAAEAEGLPSFVLNARTDAFLRAGDRPSADVLADAVERGRAYLDVGAPCVFVPGALREDDIAALVSAFGPRRLSLIGLPGLPPRDRLEELGVARVSWGPMPQRVALTALQRMVEDLAAGGGAPTDVRRLT